MLSTKSEKVVSQAINTIISKGGDHLYSQYLTAKLPSHTAQIIKSSINGLASSAIVDPPTFALVREDKMLAPKLDNYTPNKIKLKKSHASQSGMLPSRKALIKTTPIKSTVPATEKTNPEMIISTKTISAKPVPIKKLFESNAQENKIRQQKREREKHQQQVELAEESKEKKKKIEERRIKSFRKYIVENEVPYVYEDDGTIIYGIKKSVKQYKKIMNEPIVINSNPIQSEMIVNQENKEVKIVKGKKKGFYSCSYLNKKMKMTDAQYNNNYDRQQSSIPFLNLNEGVKVLEKQKDIRAAKNQDLKVNRQEYLKNNQSTCFKSYIPTFKDQIQAIAIKSVRSKSMMTRPHTTPLTQRKNCLSPKEKGKNSVLSRPKTSNHGKVIIKNQQLTKQMMNL